MNLGFLFLEELLSKKNTKTEELAEKLKVTVQAISQWKTGNQIPFKRVGQIAKLFDLDSSEIDRLLGNEPLKISFRTKTAKEFSREKASEQISMRSEVLYERFFSERSLTSQIDFNQLRKKISKLGDDFLLIAKTIREEFIIPDYAPLTSGDLQKIQERIGVNIFYMPFNQLRLKGEGEAEQTAMLYNKSNSYSILIDSDRTIDEAYFDSIHEILHLFFPEVFSTETEALIDKIAGELIYPKRYIVEKYFDGDETSRPITNKKGLSKKFYDETSAWNLILSPRGLARSMRDTGLTSANSELFSFLHSDLNDEFRKKTITYSQYGDMNVDFSSRDALFNFYEKHVGIIGNQRRYPLFERLKEDLLTEKISPSDFADTFNLKLADALVIKAMWS